MLYSLCMKFQAELVNFQDQLENRVLCKTFPSRQNSKVHPSAGACPGGGGYGAWPPLEIEKQKKK